MRYPRYQVVIVVSILALQPNPVLGQIDERDIRVLAVSHVLNSLRPYSGEPVVACVSISRLRPTTGGPGPLRPEADLDSVTLAAIPPARLPIRPGSDCYIRRVPPLPRLEKGTNRQAVMIIVGMPKFESNDVAAILVEYSINGQHGLGFICNVRRLNDAWQMVGCDQTWIS